MIMIVILGWFRYDWKIMLEDCVILMIGIFINGLEVSFLNSVLYVM